MRQALQGELLETKRECARREAELEQLKQLAARAGARAWRSPCRVRRTESSPIMGWGGDPGGKFTLIMREPDVWRPSPLSS